MPNKFVGAFKFLTQGARKGKVAPTITQPRQLKTTMKRIQSENQKFGFTPPIVANLFPPLKPDLSLGPLNTFENPLKNCFPAPTNLFDIIFCLRF